MKYSIWFCIILLIPLVQAEYRKLIPKCSNSCLDSGSAPPSNCYCDSKCSLVYNDCCLDAPYRTFRVTSHRAHNMHCAFVRGENSYFWMVDTCPDTWQGQDHVKEKCRDVETTPTDVAGSVPVTSVIDSITYKNYYCALCNEGRMEDLVEWTVKALCTNENITQDDVLHNLTYVEDREQWGIWKPENNDEDNLVFHECFLLFQTPYNVTDGIRRCIGNMVSTCPRSWKNMAVRRKCKSYVDPVKWPRGPVFRNVDCASCHNVTIEDFQCYSDVTKWTSAIMLKRALRVDMSSSGQGL